MTIKVGHIIQFVVPAGREYNCPPVEGVVYKMTYNESLKCHSIFIKPVGKMGLSVIQTGKIEYDDNFKLIGFMGNPELKRVQEEMLPYAGPPKSVKKTVKRGGIKIRENAVLEPNKDYGGYYIEGYISTKKVWKQIDRTTAKMVFFDGGRCSINNVEKVRQMK